MEKLEYLTPSDKKVGKNVQLKLELENNRFSEVSDQLIKTDRNRDLKDKTIKRGIGLNSEQFKKRQNRGGHRDSIASRRSNGSVNSRGVQGIIQRQRGGVNGSIVSRACSINIPNTFSQNFNRNKGSVTGGLSIGAALRNRKMLISKQTLKNTEELEQDELMVGGKAVFDSLQIIDQDIANKGLRDSEISNNIQ